VLANPRSALKTPPNTRLDDELFFWRQRGAASSRVDVIREVLHDQVEIYLLPLYPNVDINLGLSELVTQAPYVGTVRAHHAHDTSTRNTLSRCTMFLAFPSAMYTFLWERGSC